MEKGILNPPIDSNASQISQSTPSPINQSISPEIKEKYNQFYKITKYLIVLFVILSLSVFSYAFYQKKVSQPSTEPPVATSLQTSPSVYPLTAPSSLPESHNVFGFKLLKQLWEKDKDNLVISPSSIALALSMAYNGADGETKEAMAKTLEIQGKDISEVNQESASLISTLSNPDPKVEIAIANSIWGKKGSIFNPIFLELNNTYYGAKIDYLDFSNPDAANTINNWVKEKTREKIPTIITPPIPPDVMMYLINAIYFKGAWTHEFDQKLTHDLPFNLLNGNQKTVPMMSQKRDDFEYLENDHFQAISLPYGENNRLKMYVFLPKKDLADFISKLTIANWNQWLLLFEQKEGIIILPKFKIEYAKELKDQLSLLGMEVAFDKTGKANFTKIAPSLFINKVIHKTFIEVNEEGTEAAAVTAIEEPLLFSGDLENKLFYMTIDKPFFFAIQDSQTKEILFTGLIIEPK